MQIMYTTIKATLLPHCLTLLFLHTDKRTLSNEESSRTIADLKVIFSHSGGLPASACFFLYQSNIFYIITFLSACTGITTSSHSNNLVIQCSAKVSHKHKKSSRPSTWTHYPTSSSRSLLFSAYITQHHSLPVLFRSVHRTFPEYV